MSSEVGFVVVPVEDLAHMVSLAEEVGEVQDLGSSTLRTIVLNGNTYVLVSSVDSVGTGYMKV